MTRSSPLSYIARTSFRGALLSVALLLILGMLRPDTASSALINCNTALTINQFRNIDRAEGKKIQQALFQLYQHNPQYRKDAGSGGPSTAAGKKDPLMDGRIGKVTITWLRQFCDDFKIEAAKRPPQNVIASLFHFAAITEAHPDWRQTILSQEFDTWLRTQPVMRRQVMDEIGIAGTEYRIIALLDDFHTRRQQTAIEEDAKFIVSFKLTADDLKKLNDPKVTAKLKRLAGKRHQRQIRSESATPTVEASRSPTTYKLTSESFKKLQEEFKEIPPYIIKQLGHIENLGFLSKADLQDEVGFQIEDLFFQYKLLIFQNAQKNVAYELTKDSLDNIKNKGIPNDIMSKLESRTEEEMKFKSKDALKSKMEVAIKELTDQDLSLISKSLEEHKTYKLTEGSFEKLKKQNVPDHILNGIRDIEKDLFDHRKAIENVAETIIDGITGQYVPLIMKVAKFLLLHRKLREKSFEKLKSENVPDEIIDKIRPLKGRFYLSKKKFRKHVETAIAPVISKYHQHPPSIADAAEETISYRLTDQSLEKLDKLNVPFDLLLPLRGLINTNYPSIAAFEKAVKKAIKPLMDQYDQYPAWIADAAEESGRYGLTTQSFEALKAQGVPDAILQPLRSQQGIDYQRKAQFENTVDAIMNSVVEQYSQYPAWIADTAEESDAREATALSPQAPNRKTQSLLTEALTVLQDIEYANQVLFEQALTATVTDRNLLQPSIETIVAIARKEHPFADTSTSPINWSGGTCGCVLDDASKIVYGFYPFWLTDNQANQESTEEKKKPAEEKAKPEEDVSQPQEVDFSVLSRIGYYALSFDENGDITRHPQWEPQKASFINEARRYKTAVDLVIYKKWSQFTTAANQKNMFIDAVTDNLVNVIDQKITKPFFNQIVPIVSFGSRRVPSMANGITVYFDGEPANPESAALFTTFIQTLRKKLDRVGDGFYLNLLLPLSAFKKDSQTFRYLSKIIPNDDKPGKDDVNLILVFLEKPITGKKSDLWRQIEDMFDGPQQSNVLRKIVPILSLDDDDTGQAAQLKSNLRFFHDEFGGVGFWPLPLARYKASQGVIQLLKERIEHTNSQGTWLGQTSWLCKTICPYRWGARLTWNGLAVLWILYIAISLSSCRLRDWKYYLHLLVLVVIVIIVTAAFTAILIGCGVLWNETTTALSIILISYPVYVIFIRFKNTMVQKGAP